MNDNTVKNELPELLSAVCQHPECPRFIQDAIWEAFNEYGLNVTFSAKYFDALLEGVRRTDQPDGEEVPDDTNN